MDTALYSRSNPRLAAMHRAILKANLKGFAKFLIDFLVKILPIILPLVVAANEADAAGLTTQPPGSPIPDSVHPMVRAAIEEARLIR